MSSNRFIEVSHAGYGDTKSSEEWNSICNDEQSAVKSYIHHINETMKYLNMLGIKCDSLTIRTYFSVFYEKDAIENDMIIGNAKPLDDKAAVDFMVLNIPFESEEQKDIYYNYIDSAIDKKFYISYSKFIKMLEAMGVEFSFPTLEEIGKSAMDSQLYICDTKIQMEPTRNKKL